MSPLGATSTAATGFWSVGPGRGRGRGRGARGPSSGPTAGHRRHPVGHDAGGPGSVGRKIGPGRRTGLGIVGQLAGAGRLRGHLLEEGAQLLRRHGAESTRGGPAGRDGAPEPGCRTNATTRGRIQRSARSAANLTGRTKVRAAPVAQGIEHRPPEAGAQVRILPGALYDVSGRRRQWPYGESSATVVLPGLAWCSRRWVGARGGSRAGSAASRLWLLQRAHARRIDPHRAMRLAVRSGWV